MSHHSSICVQILDGSHFILTKEMCFHTIQEVFVFILLEEEEKTIGTKSSYVEIYVVNRLLEGPDGSKPEDILSSVGPKDCAMGILSSFGSLL